MLRRGSESKNRVDLEDVHMDSGTEFEIEDVPEDSEEPNGLGIHLDSLSVENGTQPLSQARTEGGIAPIVPDRLKEGTKLLKISKGEAKRPYLFPRC